MTEDEQLQDRFRRLARAVPQTARPVSEEKVRAAFRARFNERIRRRNYAAMIAASAVISAGLYLGWTHWTHPRVSDHETGMSAPVHQRSEFIALPYAQSEVPLEQPVIVRVQIPALELGGMGMPLAPIAGKEKVSADLLIGQDGIARAVRVVE